MLLSSFLLPSIPPSLQKAGLSPTSEQLTLLSSYFAESKVAQLVRNHVTIM